MASSWRNGYQPPVLDVLRHWGHEVYDFRHPEPGNKGFDWKEIDGGWQSWTPAAFRAALQSPIARHGFELDAKATDWADTCVLLLPCGRSAHLEAGKLHGEGKELHIFMPEACEPELMYRWAKGIHLDLDELKAALAVPAGGAA